MGRTRPGIGDSSDLRAALILKKLANYPRHNGLAEAPRETGKIERSLFGLDRYQDMELRRRRKRRPGSGCEWPVPPLETNYAAVCFNYY